MSLSQWLTAEYQDPARIRALQQQFRDAKPFAHIVLPRLLRPEKLRALERSVRTLPFSRKEADLFSFSQSPDLYTVKDTTVREFLGLLRSREFTALINTITGTKTKPGKVDAAAFIYEDTDHLLCHDDGVSSRRIAYIYNLSTLSAKNGGALSLLASDSANRPTRIVKRIIPKNNTLVLFKVTKRSHHQVDEVLGVKRMTITGWFHA